MARKNEKVSNHIPDDLVFSILSKLPLKSLKRFSCVSKSWSLLFENPLFMTMFRNYFILKHDDDNTSILLKQTIWSAQEHHCSLYMLSGERFKHRVKLDWPPPFQDNDTEILILGSGINGTLCLYKENDTTVVIWNPTTKEFKVIPQSPTGSLPNVITMVTPHGFGYDHVRNDYKVIQRAYFYLIDSDYWADVPARPNSLDPIWEIYSLRSNSWRKLDKKLNDHLCMVCPDTAEVYLNGVCHWLGETGNDDDETYVVSFDLSNEVFLTTPLSLDIIMHDDDDFDDGWVMTHLVVLKGSIALISNYVETTSFHISILGELGVKESWTKLFVVGPLSWVEHPIGVGKKGDVFFRNEDDELIWFDLRTQRIEVIGVKGESFSCQAIIYKENLLPIEGMHN